MVVDLAVEDHPLGAVFVRKRLAAAGQVDDAQTTMDEDRVIVAMNTRVVGTSVGHDVAHACGSGVGVRTKTVDGDNARDSAHVRQPSARQRAADEAA